MTTTRSDKIQGIKIIDGIYHPCSKEDVKKLIQYAKENKLTVRTVGSGHAPAASIRDENKNQICMNLDGDLRKVGKPMRVEVDGKSVVRVTVGAGCYIGVNPNDQSTDEKQKSSEENSLVKQLNDEKEAVPMLGGISHQSLGGFLTGSSGGTLYSLHDTISSITFIDGNGEERKAEKGTDLYNFMGNSMGLGGVIVEVTIEPIERYSVKGTEINALTTDKVSCFVPDEKGNYPDLKKALTTTPYMHFNLYPYCKTVTKWEGERIPYDEINRVPYKHVLANRGVTDLAALVLQLIDMLIRSEEDFTLVIEALQKVFVPLIANQEFSDIWYKALPIDDAVFKLDSKMDMEFSELWFPFEQLDEVMRRLNTLFAENPKAAGNLPTEFYGAAASPFWLAPSYGYTQGAFRVDFYWYKKNENRQGEREEFFGRFWEVLHDIPGLRFHWGKHLPKPGHTYGKYTYKTEDLSKNYDRWDDFLKMRERLDPKNLFLTEYWANHLGIKPKLQEELKPIKEKQASELLTHEQQAQEIRPEVKPVGAVKESIETVSDMPKLPAKPVMADLAPLASQVIDALRQQCGEEYASIIEVLQKRFASSLPVKASSTEEKQGSTELSTDDDSGYVLVEKPNDEIFRESPPSSGLGSALYNTLSLGASYLPGLSLFTRSVPVASAQANSPPKKLGSDIEPDLNKNENQGTIKLTTLGS